MQQKKAAGVCVRGGGGGGEGGGGGGGGGGNNYCIATYISIPEGEAGSDINIDNLGQVRMVLVCGEAL